MKVNDIIYTSGGYEQTNVNFYKVVRKTKASLELTAIGKKETGLRLFPTLLSLGIIYL